MNVLVQVTDLTKAYSVRDASGKWQRLVAVDRVSLDIFHNEVLAVVGESGCGKSTLGRTILLLETPSSGHVSFEGQDIGTLTADALRALRRRMQIVFQNPHASLDPRVRVGAAIRHPLDIHQSGSVEERRARVVELLELVGLGADLASRYPHQLSGGQAQRVAIARALALSPSLIVADEPVSALDVSIQAQILNLMSDLRDSLGLTYLFISHDLAVVEHFSTRVAVMYLGRIVELATTRSLYAEPLHPYFQGLLASVPVADPDAELVPTALRDEVASPLEREPGCRFAPRCAQVIDVCHVQEPLLREGPPGHWVACHLYSKSTLNAETTRGREHR